MSRHAEVADELRRRISSGEITDELPSIDEMGRQFGVGRATIRVALQTLTAEGLIEGGAGHLKRVRRENRMQWAMSTLELRRLADDDLWSDSVRQAGHKPSAEISVQLVQADEELSAALEVPAGDQVVLQTGLRRIDGRPHHLTDTYFPRWLVDAHPELAIPQDLSAHDRILTAADLSQAYFDDGITARMPNPEEAHKLAMDRGVPLLIHTRIGYSADDRPLRYLRTRAPADRVTFRYQVKA
ncbi:GntR family transcriptional regulator [Kribbella sp. NPDC050820]|uniref:GntR family transcriptional regulator n=1 Tax=Kribbella sp. NPDC050820 TaxID=3155408 RepID=UPI0033E4FCBB